MRHGQPILQVSRLGLRQRASLHLLGIPRARKFLLIPHAGDQLPRFMRTLEAERLVSGAPPLDQWDAGILPRLPNQEYDAWISRSVVFLHLHGAVANNAIIESIVRQTPVLVNPLPSVQEYLGAGYPLYFESLDEAAAKACDPDLVLAAHRYLAAMDSSWLSGETFRRELAESELYRSLPAPADEFSR